MAAFSSQIITSISVDATGIIRLIRQEIIFKDGTETSRGIPEVQIVGAGATQGFDSLNPTDGVPTPTDLSILAGENWPRLQAMLQLSA